MKKLITAAAVAAFALAMAPAMVGHAWAAAAKSPYCNMAPATGSASWAEFYGCWGGAPKTQGQPAPAPVAYNPPGNGPGATDFCKMAPATTSASWAEHYHCWHH